MTERRSNECKHSSWWIACIIGLVASALAVPSALHIRSVFSMIYPIPEVTAALSGLIALMLVRKETRRLAPALLAVAMMAVGVVTFVLDFEHVALHVQRVEDAQP